MLRSLRLSAHFLPTFRVRRFTFSDKPTLFNGLMPTNIYHFFMQVDKDLISRLEKLARLQLDPAERDKLTTDLNSILQMVDKLSELDTTGVEPLIYLNDTENVLREDVVGAQLTPEEALRNAPKQDGQFFRVPKVIE